MGTHSRRQLPWWLIGKEFDCNTGDVCSIPGSGSPPGERKWQPTPVFLPGKFHRQRSLAGYSPWDCQESDITEPMSAYTRARAHTHMRARAHTHTHTHTRRHSFKPKVPEIQRYRIRKETEKKKGTSLVSALVDYCFSPTGRGRSVKCHGCYHLELFGKGDSQSMSNSKAIVALGKRDVICTC